MCQGQTDAHGRLKTMSDLQLTARKESKARVQCIKENNNVRTTEQTKMLSR